MFEGMVAGWARQQKSGCWARPRSRLGLSLLRRFTEFAECYPWAWTAGDMEDFTVALMSGGAAPPPRRSGVTT